MDGILRFLHVLSPVKDHTAADTCPAILHLPKEEAIRLYIIVEQDLIGAKPPEVVPQKAGQFAAHRRIIDCRMKVLCPTEHQLGPLEFLQRQQRPSFFHIAITKGHQIIEGYNDGLLPAGEPEPIAVEPIETDMYRLFQRVPPHLSKGAAVMLTQDGPGQIKEVVDRRFGDHKAVGRFSIPGNGTKRQILFRLRDNHKCFAVQKLSPRFYCAATRLRR